MHPDLGHSPSGLLVARAPYHFGRIFTLALLAVLVPCAVVLAAAPLDYVAYGWVLGAASVMLLGFPIALAGIARWRADRRQRRDVGTA